MFLKKLTNAPLFKRAVGTLIYGVIFLWLVSKGGIPFLAAIAVLTVIAAYEFYRMFSHGGHRPFYVSGMVAALIFVADAYFGQGILRPGLTAVIAFSLAWMALERGYHWFSKVDSSRNTFLDWSLTLAGAIYTGGLLSHTLLIRSLPNGAAFMMTVAFGTAACDAAGYLVGHYFGRHKFFARISPKKTWEGAIGGFLSSTVVVLLMAPLIGIGTLNALFWGMLLGVFAIFGDLAESMFKRETGVKDSGSWIPEQGGLLDVIDGFLFAIVLSYYYVIWVIRPS
jgi:phosphatidate cytidylyltransferase